METHRGILPPMGARHHRYTADDLAQLERHEVVGGELVEKAAPSFSHGDVQGTIYGSLLGFRGRGGGEGRPGGWWLGIEVHIELGPQDIYCPDVAGWRIERVPEPPPGMPVRVVPDWVCEVLSPSTMGRDLGHKQRTYYQAKIAHYWVVDPIKQGLTVYRWQESRYVPVLDAGVNDIVRAEPFDAIDIDIGYLFDMK